ncbi:MAG: type II toxin-antitoxin system prevent-host-death family antitoxin [Acidobacteriota bacterium]
MTILPASEARAGLSEILNRVAFGGERIVLERHGKHVAAIVPMSDLSSLEAKTPAGRVSDRIPVSYLVRNFPRLGDVLVAATAAGLCRVIFGQSAAALSARMRREISHAAPSETPLLRKASAELAEYAAGKRRDFTVPVDPAAYATPFARRVLLEATCAIPFGRVRTYGEIARAVGSPAAARAVGGALGANPVPIVVPCHRVVAAGGLGGYSGGTRGSGLRWKRELLSIEGALPGAA